MYSVDECFLSVVGVCDFTAMPAPAFEQLATEVDVGDIWGIGRHLGEQLHDAGITTVKALCDARHDWLRARFGVVMSRLWHELHGLSRIALEETPTSKKQIISSRSFGVPVLLFDDLVSVVSTYVTRAAEKLRAQASTCEALQVFVMANAFRPQDPQYSNAVTVPLPNASNDTRLLAKAATLGLRRIYREGYRYKKAGVVLIGISDANRQQQGSIFPLAGASERSAKLMSVLDELNQTFGRDTVSLGAVGSRQVWRMRAERRSPCFQRGGPRYRSSMRADLANGHACQSAVVPLNVPSHMIVQASDIWENTSRYCGALIGFRPAIAS